MDLFQQKDIRPMKIIQTSPVFNSKDYIYELKLPGIRCIAYLNQTETDLRSSTNVPLLPLLPELSYLHRTVKKTCILDGELIVINQGTTDQNAILKRFDASYSTTPTILPVSYVAFDLLYLNGQQMTSLPLMTRKCLLEENVQETLDLTISRYIEDRGTELLELARNEHLDGVIAKQKDSIYQMGALSDSWVQFLSTPMEYYILCGYVVYPDGSSFFLLGQYDNSRLLYKGKLSMKECIGNQSLRQYISQNEIHFLDQSPFLLTPVFQNDSKIFWFAPEMVCKIELQNDFATTPFHGHFAGLCQNILAKDCITKKTGG